MTTSPSIPPLTNGSTGDGITSDRAEWKFTKDVAANFDTHVQKSVPYYAETHQLAIAMSDWFVHDHAKVYDLGCATGHLLVDLRKRHVGKGLQCTGLDSSQPMIDQAQIYLRGYNGITLKCADVLKEPFDEDIALFYSLYTLQFVNPQERLGLCRKIHASLAQRGAFILVEKILDADPVLTDVYIHLHWSKKAEMGFDVSEIYNKAQALRGVLVPFTSEENIRMLQEAGFSRVSTFFKWCNFCGVIAVK